MAGCGGGRAPAGPPPSTPVPPAPAAAPVHVQSGPTLARPVVVVGRVRVTEPAADDAVDALARFVAAHPDHPRATPDALLRLGSLYLDQADVALDGDRLDDATALAGRAAAALRDARDRFPAYPRADLVQYQLGYAAELTGDRAAARAAYLALAALATSPLAAEGWFRAGELAFDDGDLPAAVDAYQRVPRANRLGAIAAFKLAWSHWRSGAMDAAEAGFQAVLDRGDPDGAALAPEARQYVALALIEDDRDGDGAAEPAPAGGPSATVARVLGYVGDGADAGRRAVAALAADALVDDARYPEADAIYASLLARGLADDERARLEAGRARLRARTH